MTHRHLLADPRQTEIRYNVHLQPGRVTKDPRNPLLREGQFANPPVPWESRYDNLYPNVVYDTDAGLYKCWYFCFLHDELSAATPLADRPITPYRGGPREEALLYVTSTDGVTWQRPVLGSIPFDGSTANNIVMSKTSHGIHAGGIYKDEHDQDPARRYKALFRNAAQRRMAVAFSADGVNWLQSLLWPKHDAVGDTHNNALWFPELQRYVGITRGWSERPYHGVRTVLRTTSSDFVNWSEPVEIMRGADEHDQIYSMPIFRYGGLTWGLPAIFHKGDPEAADWDTVDTELAFSVDTVDWQRVSPGTLLIPRGAGTYPDGAYDCGCVYAAAPVVTDDEIIFYYGGSNGLHNGWREGSLNRATLPRDRLAGYTQTAVDEPGFLLSTPLMLSDAAVTLNCDVGPDGSVRGAIYADDAPLAGFDFRDCSPLTAGGLRVPLQWSTKPPTDRPIQLAIALEQATVYAFAN